MSALDAAGIDTTTDPLFVLARRDPKRRRRLLGYEIALHEDIFDELRSIGRETLDLLQDLEEREYEPTAQLERGEECFVIHVADPPRPQHSDATADELEGIADLLAFVADPTRLDSMSAAEIRSNSFLAYGIVLRDKADNRMGFFRQEDPARPVNRGRVFGRFTDALRRVENPPSLILYTDIDVVVTPQRIFALRKAAFQRLLADVDVALAEVDTSVDRVTTLLGDRMPLAQGAEDAVRSVGARRPSFALRLRRLGVRARELSDAGLTGQQVRQAITAVDGDPDSLLNRRYEFEFGEQEVGAFLDVLEGRWYKDALGGEPRRADRYSSRS